MTTSAFVLRLLQIEASGVDISETLGKFNKILDSLERRVYTYDDLEREISDGHRSADIHYVNEFLLEFGYHPILSRKKRHLHLAFDGRAFLFAKSEIQNKEYGFNYLFYSNVLKYYKVGRTENLIRKRIADYPKSEGWVPVFYKFTKHRLRTKENRLKAYCAGRFLQAPKGIEYFYMGCTSVMDVISFMKNL